MAFQQLQKGQFTLHRWLVGILLVSIWKQETLQCCSRQLRTKEHDEFGLILETEYGSVNGTQENWVCIILLPIYGKNGNCLEIIHPYAVFVDDKDMVWLSNFGSNALVRFDASQEKFEVYSLSSPDANVCQILGRAGEVWGAESGVDKLVVIRTNN